MRSKGRGEDWDDRMVDRGSFQSIEMEGMIESWVEDGIDVDDVVVVAAAVEYDGLRWVEN